MPESYVFRHILIRDTAYSMLLRDRRRHLHELVAEVLSRWRSRTGVAPELLAYHYTMAGLIEPAIRYWLLAGRQASKMAAYVEAERHLRKGLGLLIDRRTGACAPT